MILRSTIKIHAFSIPLLPVMLWMTGDSKSGIKRMSGQINTRFHLEIVCLLSIVGRTQADINLVSDPEIKEIAEKG